MKHPLLLTLFYLAVALCPFLAVAEDDSQGCSQYVETVVNMKPHFDETEYNYTTPMLQIRDLSQTGKQKTTHEKHGEAWPVGLATGEMFFDITTNSMKMYLAGGKMVCAQIKTVNVEFGFRNNIIYVAKEFPKRSCPYKEVQKHEEKHKAVDQQIVQEYEGKIKTALTEVSKKIGVIKANSSSIIDDQINSTFNQAVQKITKEAETEHLERQKQVDTKEEYQRITDSCDGQTMEVVRQRLQILEESHPGITKVKE